ncbi:MAG: SDR family NAD(P)-dependent oxidoreductase [Synechococcaceae cyanobacterium SM2_3_1]|nr:SDR family NAD(P)-dependent oxidoreductase [Synechococcaceae cyanobacterium SM2_3_1]
MNISLATLSNRFPQKRAFVTGAASGLGYEFCKHLALNGWSVAMLDYNLEQVEQKCPEIQSLTQGVVKSYHVNVADGEQFKAAVDDYCMAVNGVDLLINNAGILAMGGFETYSIDDWQKYIGVNLIGVINGCQFALPHMTKAHAGIILNIASKAALLPGLLGAPYPATKAAVLSLSETLFVEYFYSPIQISVALPGVFQSNLPTTVDQEKSRLKQDLKAKQQEWYRRRPTAEKIATNILQKLASGQLYIIPDGPSLPVQINAGVKMVMLRVMARIQKESVDSQTG